MTADPPVPPGVDPTVPSPARIYDYLHGGTYNFASDRAAAKRALDDVPEVKDIVSALRGFHGRAVRWIAEQGITQFLDIGSGLPTVGNTHEIAGQVNPAARVMYIDNDPMVAAAVTDLLAGNQTVRFTPGDIRQPGQILDNPDVRGFLDFTQPLGLILCAVIHFVSDDDNPAALMDRYIAELAPGSYLALSHATADKTPPTSVQAGKDTYANAAQQLHFRTAAEIERYFAGLELIPPFHGAGSRLAYVGEWGAEDPGHADTDGSRWNYCGVGRRD